MPVKVLDASGKGYLSDAAVGIAWAVKHGADIINVSLGAPSTMPALDTALAAAERFRSTSCAFPPVSGRRCTQH
jgi:subtilisin family serine protease